MQGLQKGNQEGSTKYGGNQRDGRGHAGDANRTGEAFSPRRAGDPALMLTNNKMINLVEQILGGSGIRADGQHGNEIGIGSYQQSVLFP